MKKFIFILILCLLSGCSSYLTNADKQNLKEIVLDSYEIGYITGKKNLNHDIYRNKIINSLDKYLNIK